MGSFGCTGAGFEEVYGGAYRVLIFGCLFRQFDHESSQSAWNTS